LCIYTARRAFALAHNEGTTTGQARVHDQSKNPTPSIFAMRLRLLGERVHYQGHGICPKQTDHSVTGTLENLAGILQKTSVTVYYDPANPTFNSMMEFGAKSVYDYKKAKLSFLAGAALLIFTVVGASYLASATRRVREWCRFQRDSHYPDQSTPKQQE